MNFREIFNNTDAGPGRILELAIQGLILFSLISFCVETLPDLSPATRTFLYWSEVVIVIVFSIEYLARLLAPGGGLRFIFSFYGIIDLCAILPFYLSVGFIDLRSLRVLRAFKLFRYSRALRRYRDAFRELRDELTLFFMATIFLLFLSAVGIYYFENEAQPGEFRSVFHAMWWAVATLTTVGYGDVYPVTVGGRLFTFVILMLGLGIVAVPSGLLASAMTRSRSRDKTSRQAPGPGAGHERTDHAEAGSARPT